MNDERDGDPAGASTAAGAPVRSAERVAARASHMMGADFGSSTAGAEAMAWEGLLEVARRLRRGAEELLLEQFELSISMLGITGRLSLAPARTLRQTALAQAMGLSLSRVSRVIDLLEQRGLVERRRCPVDARATNVRLTRPGISLTRRAQRSLFEYVQASFFERLEAGDAETLASVFSRVLEGTP